MKKIIKIKEGDIIPEGAKLIKKERILIDVRKIYSHTDYGLFFSDVYYIRIPVYETYFYYEVGHP